MAESVEDVLREMRRELGDPDPRYFSTLWADRIEAALTRERERYEDAAKRTIVAQGERCDRLEAEIAALKRKQPKEVWAASPSAQLFATRESAEKYAKHLDELVGPFHSVNRYEVKE